jgi:hypothetical protein
MQDAATLERIRDKYVALVPVMDERMRRHWAAVEAMAMGWGGVSAVSIATGLVRNTIASGVRELAQRREQCDMVVTARLRQPGAGRKRITETDPQLLHALEELVDPATRGHPESPLRWTCKSTAKLAEELARQNHPVTDRTVATLLKRTGYSLQANRKTREGSSHPDRNAQFEYINKGNRSRPLKLLLAHFAAACSLSLSWTVADRAVAPTVLNCKERSLRSKRRSPR